MKDEYEGLVGDLDLEVGGLMKTMLEKLVEFRTDLLKEKAV